MTDIKKIGVLGDVHGNANVVLASLKRFFADDVMHIVQVGDMGFWPGKHGSAFLAYVNTLLAKNGQTMYVIPGNHDDYNFINEIMTHVVEYEDGWARARSHILVAPRGHRWEWNGVSFVGLGGAPSVDRAYRLVMQRTNAYPLWWADEDITPEDVEKTVAGGYADVMIAHDAPLGVKQVEKHIYGNPSGFKQSDLDYAYEGRRKMLTAIDGVKPKIFFHGHYHHKIDDVLTFDDGTETKIKGLNSDGYVNSDGILDLETLEFSWYDQ